MKRMFEPKQGSVLFKGVVIFIVTAVVAVCLCADVLSVKQTDAAIAGLPAPTDMVKLSSTQNIPALRGVIFNPQNPLELEFLIDSHGKKKVSSNQKDRLIKYFLTALTVPEKNMWVNLSPYENDRIINNDLSVTDLGRDMLAQDYLLKQLSSSLTHPDTPIGKAYWEGQGRISPISDFESRISNLSESEAFNKIWIVPEKMAVYENENIGIITDAILDVKTQADYNASQQAGLAKQNNPNNNPVNPVKEILISKIKNDVNTGRNFARLRQIYNSLILASWFKSKFQNTVYTQYINNNKLKGVDTVSPETKQKIWNLYCESFKKGVYNLTRKEPVNPPRVHVERGQAARPRSTWTRGRVKNRQRRFFSGGVKYAFDPDMVHNDLSRVSTSSAVRTKVGLTEHVVQTLSAKSSSSLTLEEIDLQLIDLFERYLESKFDLTFLGQELSRLFNDGNIEFKAGVPGFKYEHYVLIKKEKFNIIIKRVLRELKPFSGNVEKYDKESYKIKDNLWRSLLLLPVLDELIRYIDVYQTPSMNSDKVLRLRAKALEVLSKVDYKTILEKHIFNRLDGYGLGNDVDLKELLQQEKEAIRAATKSSLSSSGIDRTSFYPDISEEDLNRSAFRDMLLNTPDLNMSMQNVLRSYYDDSLVLSQRGKFLGSGTFARAYRDRFNPRGHIKISHNVETKTAYSPYLARRLVAEEAYFMATLEQKGVFKRIDNWRRRKKPVAYINRLVGLNRVSETLKNGKQEGSLAVQYESIDNAFSFPESDYYKSAKLSDLILVLIKVCNAVGAVHAANFICNDMTLEDILVNLKGEVLLNDIIIREIGLNMNGKGGTNVYIPPENRRYKVSDVYTFGIIMRKLIDKLIQDNRFNFLMYESSGLNKLVENTTRDLGSDATPLPLYLARKPGTMDGVANELTKIREYVLKQEKINGGGQSSSNLTDEQKLLLYYLKEAGMLQQNWPVFMRMFDPNLGDERGIHLGTGSLGAVYRNKKYPSRVIKVTRAGDGLENRTETNIHEVWQSLLLGHFNVFKFIEYNIKRKILIGKLLRPTRIGFVDGRFAFELEGLAETKSILNSEFFAKAKVSEIISLLISGVNVYNMVHATGHVCNDISTDNFFTDPSGIAVVGDMFVRKNGEDMQGAGGKIIDDPMKKNPMAPEDKRYHVSDVYSVGVMIDEIFAVLKRLGKVTGQDYDDSVLSDLILGTTRVHTKKKPSEKALMKLRWPNTMNSTVDELVKLRTYFIEKEKRMTSNKTSSSLGGETSSSIPTIQDFKDGVRGLFERIWSDPFSDATVIENFKSLVEGDVKLLFDKQSKASIKLTLSIGWFLKIKDLVESVRDKRRVPQNASDNFFRTIFVLPELLKLKENLEVQGDSLFIFSEVTMLLKLLETIEYRSLPEEYLVKYLKSEGFDKNKLTEYIEVVLDNIQKFDVVGQRISSALESAEEMIASGPRPLNNDGYVVLFSALHEANGGKAQKLIDFIIRCTLMQKFVKRYSYEHDVESDVNVGIWHGVLYYQKHGYIDGFLGFVRSPINSAMIDTARKEGIASRSNLKVINGIQEFKNKFYATKGRNPNSSEIADSVGLSVDVIEAARNYQLRPAYLEDFRIENSYHAMNSELEDEIDQMRRIATKLKRRDWFIIKLKKMGYLSLDIAKMFNFAETYVSTKIKEIEIQITELRENIVSDLTPPLFDTYLDLEILKNERFTFLAQSELFFEIIKFLDELIRLDYISRSDVAIVLDQLLKEVVATLDYRQKLLLNIFSDVKDSKKISRARGLIGSILLARKLGLAFTINKVDKTNLINLFSDEKRLLSIFEKIEAGKSFSVSFEPRQLEFTLLKLKKVVSNSSSSVDLSDQDIKGGVDFEGVSFGRNVAVSAVDNDFLGYTFKKKKSVFIKSVQEYIKGRV